MSDIAKERVLLYPDRRLRQIAEPIASLTDDDRGRIFRMLKLLVEEGGIGLAAPQIGWGVRLFVMNTHPDHDPAFSVAVINPTIVSTSDRRWIMGEGCLSFPGVFGKVERPWSVVFEGQNLEGATARYELEGLAARCMLHELEHLDGVLFIDHFSPARQHSIKGKLKRLEQFAAGH